MAKYCAMEVKNCNECSGEGSISADQEYARSDIRSYSGPLVTNPCPTCQGKGEILTPAPLRKVLKELGFITWRDFSYMKSGLGRAAPARNDEEE